MVYNTIEKASEIMVLVFVSGNTTFFDQNMKL